jgi:hypothetical protein
VGIGGEEQIECPAVLAAEDAKALCHEIIAHRWAKRDKLTLRLPPSFLALEPGDALELPFSPPKWTVETCTLDAFVVVAELTPQ